MGTFRANYRIRSLDAAAADQSAVTDTLRIADHGLSTGDAVGVLPTAAGSLDTALTSTTPYYVIQHDAHRIQLATSYANAFAGTEVALNADAVGNTRVFVGGIGRVLLGAFPTNAVLRNVKYDVITTFESRTEAAGYDGAAGDLAAIGLELVSISATQVVAQDTSIIDETAATSTISDAEVAWDSGGFAHDDIIAPDAATVDDAVKPGADLQVAVSIEDNGEVLTVGEANFVIEYDVSFTSA